MDRYRSETHMNERTPYDDFNDDEERHQVMGRILYGGVVKPPQGRDTSTAGVSTCWSADGREDQDLRPADKWPKSAARKARKKA